jgi:hypothetical protein
VNKLIVGMLLVTGVAAVYLLMEGNHGKKATLAVKTAGVVYRQPGIVDESNRQFMPFHSFVVPTVEATAEEQRVGQVNLGGVAEVKFTVRDRNPAAPRTSHAHLKAYALHGRDTPIELPLKESEKDKNKVTVAFTPPTNGQFNIVLTENDNPVGSHRVSVIGSAAANTSLTDPNQLDEADPITYANRTWNRGLHRR